MNMYDGVQDLVPDGMWICLLGGEKGRWTICFCDLV
jgi:hypothetical protein